MPRAIGIAMSSATTEMSTVAAKRFGIPNCIASVLEVSQGPV